MEKDNNFTKTTIIVTVLIIGLWVLTYFVLIDNDNKGVIGDMFGTINALFSGLALAGIILTILLQRTELSYQRNELKETRKEFKIQNKTLKIQRFENTFFNLLNLHHQIVKDIDYRYYKIPEKNSLVESLTADKEIVIINGRDVFRYRYNKMYEKLKKTPDKHITIYNEHYKKAQTDFSHYFSNLYRMIKRVDQLNYSNKKDKTKEFITKYRYVSMIRSQISDFELLWVFYCGINDEKFKCLLEKYTFFKNLPKDLITDIQHIDLYDKLAYEPEGEKMK